MSPKVRSNVKSTRPAGRRGLAGLCLMLALLACTMGQGPSPDPLFVPPGDGLAATPSPDAVTPAATDTPAATAPPVDLLETPTPLTALTPSGGETPTPGAPGPTQPRPLLYLTQAGDTLPVVAAHFGVDPALIDSPDPLAETGLLPPGQLLIIPPQLINTTSPQKILPDSELVFSPSATDFDVAGFVQEAGGYLSTYKEYLNSTGNTSGARIVARVALENSINPRLLLALLEYQSGWVYGQPGNAAMVDYPMGQIELNRKGLYLQLAWAVNQLSIGYYGWRDGSLLELTFSDGPSARLAPDLNAGTAALQYYFTQVYDSGGWVAALDPYQGLLPLYTRMFGDPWLRAHQVEPLYPTALAQPTMILPFMVGQLWSFTGGPHGAWEHDGAWAALDFAPATDVAGCSESLAWALAAAPGRVARLDRGVLVLDLDGDGSEQTGWALLYLHVSVGDRLQVGEWVETGALLGHPSCEGGKATGTHIHLARKYNGEWIAADGPVSFVLSGWTAHAGTEPYKGSLTKDGETVWASVFGSYESRITREREP